MKPLLSSHDSSVVSILPRVEMSVVIQVDITVTPHHKIYQLPFLNKQIHMHNLDFPRICWDR